MVVVDKNTPMCGLVATMHTYSKTNVCYNIITVEVELLHVAVCFIIVQV